MACSITNLKVTAVGSPGGTASSITISGHAEDCKKVHVEFSCGLAPFIAEVAVDAATGDWSVTTSNLPCSCTKPFKLLVQCVEDPTCRAGLSSALICQPAGGQCPVVGNVVINFAADCNAVGTRDVTISATITNGTAGVVVGQWEFEPGVFGPTIVVSAGTTLPVSQTHAYVAPGTYTAVLSFSLPAGCPPLSVVVDVEACPPVCLEKEDVVVTVSPTCNASGQRRVTFTFPLVITGTLNFGDATSIGFIGSSVSHDYTPPGPFTATLIVAGCERVQIPVGPLDPCPINCPTPGSIGVTVAPDCNPNGTRDVKFTLPFFATAQIDFGDGQAAGFSGSSITHPYSPTGPYTATVTVAGCPPIQVPVGPLDKCGGPSRGACCLPDKSCVETTEEECIQKGGKYQGDGTLCATTDCEPTNGGGGGLCGIFAPLIALLLAAALGLTLGLITLQFCLHVPVPQFVWVLVIGLWALAALLIIAWYILCNLPFLDCDCPKKCDWMAISWTSLLAGGIVALYLSGCCPLMKGISVALFGLWLAAFILWLKKCHPTRCQILDYATIAFVTAAGTALTYLALVPPLHACALTSVAAAASTLGALLAAAAVACHSNE